MNMTIEEKRYNAFARGNIIAKACFFVPCFTQNEDISAFYREEEEKLCACFEKSKERYIESYEKMERSERRGFEPICIRLFSSAVYAERPFLSVMQEYAVSRGKNILSYRRMCQFWHTEKGLLLPASAFLPKRQAKRAEKNEFYFDGENIIVIENIFPQKEENGGSAFDSFVRTTCFKAQKRPNL